MKFTAIIEQGENGWFVGQVDEVPAAMSQAKTISDLKMNLLEALMLVLNSDTKIDISCR